MNKNDLKKHLQLHREIADMIDLCLLHNFDSPHLCVRNNGIPANESGWWMLDKNLDDYQIAVTISNGTPLFKGDKIVHENEGLTVLSGTPTLVFASNASGRADYYLNESIKLKPGKVKLPKRS